VPSISARDAGIINGAKVNGLQRVCNVFAAPSCGGLAVTSILMSQKQYKKERILKASNLTRQRCVRTVGRVLDVHVKSQVDVHAPLQIASMRVASPPVHEIGPSNKKRVNRGAHALGLGQCKAHNPVS